MSFFWPSCQGSFFLRIATNSQLASLAQGSFLPDAAGLTMLLCTQYSVICVRPILCLRGQVHGVQRALPRPCSSGNGALALWRSTQHIPLHGHGHPRGRQVRLFCLPCTIVTECVPPRGPERASCPLAQQCTCLPTTSSSYHIKTEVVYNTSSEVQGECPLASLATSLCRPQGGRGMMA